MFIPRYSQALKSDLHDKPSHAPMRPWMARCSSSILQPKEQSSSYSSAMPIHEKLPLWPFTSAPTQKKL
jgi:hypothetical protein